MIIKTDACPQPVDQAAEAAAVTYEPPRVVALGPSNELIRGNWTSGVWDGGPLQWWVSGE